MKQSGIGWVVPSQLEELKAIRSSTLPARSFGLRQLEYLTATSSRSGRDFMPTHVRQALSEDHPSILEIAKSLHSEWFSELGLQDIARDLQIEHGLIAQDNGKAVGFVIYSAKDDKTAELSWIGVRPELHRKGIGRALVNALEAILAQSGFRTLEVSTVAPTIEDESYARTRSFYHAVGFLDVQIDEKWYSTGDDRLLLRKPLSSPTKSCSKQEGARDRVVTSCLGFPNFCFYFYYA